MLKIPTTFSTRSFFLALTGLFVGVVHANNLHTNDHQDHQKLKVLIETDMGGDKDDQASFVRWLLYTCEWDVKGIVFDRADDQFQRDPAAGNPSNALATMEMAYDYLDAYTKVHDTLLKNNPDYPTAAYLKSVSVHGTNDSNAGRDLIIKAIDKTTMDAPIWYSNWGSNSGTRSNLRRALDYIQENRTDAEYKAFIAKLRIVTLDGQNTTRQGHQKNIPFHVEVGFPQLGDDIEGRWYRRFNDITATANGFDVNEDVLNNHGPLGKLYTGQKEGDSWSFIYLIPTGLSDPNQPTWGGWAGRYGVRDGGSDVPHRAPFYWANQEDTWNGSTNRDNCAQRFAVALQNDFKARMDWCVLPFDRTNHPPVVFLQNDETTQVLTMDVEPGEKITLAATAIDPDENPMAFTWWVYPEAGTYSGQIVLENSDTNSINLIVPKDAAGTSIHLICEVTDSGIPALTRYRRAVIQCRKSSDGVNRSNNRF